MMKDKYIAFNKLLLLFLIPPIVLSAVAVFCFIINEWALFVGILLFDLLAVCEVLLQPISVVFTKEHLTIIYTIGVKEVIEIKKIIRVYEHGWSVERGLPAYGVWYPHQDKNPFFVNGNIPKTRKSQKLINQFCGSKLK